jgi:glutamyl-tRNA synthetase
MTRQQFIDNFTLERVSKTAASFNYEKLDWMNGVYIRGLEPEDFLQRSLSFVEEDLPPEVPRPLSIGYIRQIMPLVQERVKTLAEISGLVRFFFTDQLEYETDLLIAKDMTPQSTRHALEVARQRLAELPVFDDESLEEMLRPLAVELELKTGQLFGTLRTAITGQVVAPPLFQTMAVLGRETCLQRIDRALERL